jgi:hypothetical protein
MKEIPLDPVAEPEPVESPKPVERVELKNAERVPVPQASFQINNPRPA